MIPFLAFATVDLMLLADVPHILANSSDESAIANGSSYSSCVTIIQMCIITGIFLPDKDPCWFAFIPQNPDFITIEFLDLLAEFHMADRLHCVFKTELVIHSGRRRHPDNRRSGHQISQRLHRSALAADRHAGRLSGCRLTAFHRN